MEFAYFIVTTINIVLSLLMSRYLKVMEEVPFLCNLSRGNFQLYLTSGLFVLAHWRVFLRSAIRAPSSVLSRRTGVSIVRWVDLEPAVGNIKPDGLSMKEDGVVLSLCSCSTSTKALTVWQEWKIPLKWIRGVVGACGEVVVHAQEGLPPGVHGCAAQWTVPHVGYYQLKDSRQSIWMECQEKENCHMSQNDWLTH